MATNPFEDADEGNNCEILEGFLCPICHVDLKSIEFLTDHFERSHAEEQDAVKSIIKDIFTRAKKKIMFNFDEPLHNHSVDKRSNAADNNASSSECAGGSWPKASSQIFSLPQAVGMQRDHLAAFQAVRNPRLERYTSETNKLIIRLHKLLKDIPVDPAARKQRERNIVPWLDGSSVKLCPDCAKNFHIARRQHHCRLCGSVMCHDCSKFLSYDSGVELASMSATENGAAVFEKDTSLNSIPALRVCYHCLWLLENRQDMQDSRLYRPPITQIYDEIKQLHKNIAPELEMYLKIIGSLYDGESLYTISDASVLRGKIGQTAEAIDLRSKRIMALSTEAGSKEETLKKSIRQSCLQMIKERMLSLPPLPAEEQIRKIQEQKRYEAEQRIKNEQQMAMAAYARYGLNTNQTATTQKMYENGNIVHGTDLHSLNNWSAHQVKVSGVPTSDDPLVEQINIIKGYIKQAKLEMNYDVVETLEINLSELQREFYERQKAAATQPFK